MATPSIGDLVVVSNEGGTLGLDGSSRSIHRHMRDGELGVVVNTRGRNTWMVQVLFPPGVILDVVLDHFSILGRTNE